jgi:outer membrane protein OmpA-like peptidoglycan-associated protein
MNNGPTVVLRTTLPSSMRIDLQDISTRCGLFFVFCLALLSVSHEARGQLIIARGAASDVLVVDPIDALQGTPQHNVSLSEQERDEAADVVREKPKIDLELQFDPDSVVISPLSRMSFDALGHALSDPGLKDMTFIIAGHTDSLEEEAYSQRLSERRADAVKRELVKYFNIPKANLVSVGYGSSNLKNPINPFDSQNNRVQVVNMDVQKH